MKKITIATLVGTAICFIWLSLAWMALPVHENAIRYTNKQDTILQCLTANLHETGVYGVPAMNPDSKNMEEDMVRFEKLAGKPWALVFYNKEWRPFSMGYLFNGILLTLVSVFIVVLILHIARASLNTYSKRFFVVLLIAGFCIFQAVLDDWNWWSFPTHFIQTQIFDLVFSWALCGMFLAWYMKEDKQLTIDN